MNLRIVHMKATEDMKKKKERAKVLHTRRFCWTRQLQWGILCTGGGCLLSGCGKVGSGAEIGIDTIFIILIVSCFVVGFLSFIKAYMHLLIGERLALNEVEGWFDGEAKLNAKVIIDLMQESREEGQELKPVFEHTLVGDRLVCIKKYYERAVMEEGRSIPPRLQDLHRMTEQALTSRSSVGCLRFMSNALLILGICGTLWCVHGVMGGAANKIASMGEALVPSGTAVAATIVLLFMRSVFESRSERFLSRLDDLTMCYILPRMQTMGKFSENLQKFANNVEAFAESISSYTGVADKLRGFVDTIHGNDDRMRHLGTKIDETFKRLNDHWQRWQLAYDEARKQSESLEQVLRNARSLTDAMVKNQQNLTTAVEEVDIVAKSVGAVGEEWKGLSNGVNQLTANVQQASNQLGTLLTAQDNSEKFLSMLEQLNTTVNEKFSAVQRDISQWTVESHALNSSAAGIKASSEQLRADLDKVHRTVSALRRRTGAPTKAASIPPSNSRG